MPLIETDNTLIAKNEFRKYLGLDDITITYNEGEIQPWCSTLSSELSINSYISHKTFNRGIPDIEHIYVNEGKRTIVIKWLTGERTKVKCAKDDTWNVEAGINAAVVKYITKSNHAYYKDIRNKIEYQD